MVLRTATKDENVPRPRTLILVAARDGGRATLDRGRGRSEVLDNAPLVERSPAAPVLKALYGSPTIHPLSGHPFKTQRVSRRRRCRARGCACARNFIA
jgi:hypothetical protein